VIRYKSQAPDDFDKLRHEIVQRLEAPPYQRVNSEPVDRIDVRGLEQHELFTLVTIGSELRPCSLYSVASDLEKHGFTQLAGRLATETLCRAGLLETSEEPDGNSVLISSAMLP
jgi:hypothetical protein